MAKTTSLHHVALRTDRFDEAVAFYRDGLSLTPVYAFRIGEGKRALILRCGEGADSGHVEIFERDEADEDVPAEGRLLHLALATPDVDAMYEKALAAGATSRMEPTDPDHVNALPAEEQPAGAERFTPRIAFVTGPTGEIIEFFRDQLAVG